MEQPIFKVNDLFFNQAVAQSLMKVEVPASLTLKPSYLYDKIKAIVKARYRFDLPEKQEGLVCLKSGNNKLSLLRDICMKLGIKLVATEEREYILDNDNGLYKLQLQQARLQHLKNTALSKKKGPKNVAMEENLMNY